ncbi:MAG: V4R domain-containing protein, partial [Desulfomonilaceae bacterium]
QWKDLGNIEEGRPNMGPTTAVSVYRLMQFTLRDVLISKYGVDTTNEILVEAGRLAGSEFCANLLDRNLNLDEFIFQLQEKLKTLNIGILRVEKADIDSLEFMLTVSEDLDCSGLPLLGETVCCYDEGFIAGILNSYIGKEFDVKEIDCWASGARTCRFLAKIKT